MTDRQSTHGHDCWGWGQKHYECAVREIERLREQLRLTTVDQAAAEAEANDARAEIEALREEIGRLLDSREREGDRLDWLLARLPGDVIRDLVGEMSCTSDVGEWRDRIDKAARFKPPNT